MLRKALLNLMLAALVLLGPQVAGAAFTLDSSDLVQEQIFQDALQRSMAQCRVPGVVAAVRSPQGSLWRGSAGLADMETRERMNLDLHFHIGSLTKTFTATLFLQLCDRGLASLDDTVERWLPGALRNGDQITMRHLLQMRSGLGHYEKNPEFRERFIAQPRHPWPPEDLVALCDQETSPVGSRFDYNNVNYILAGMVIEKILGQPYYLAVRENILAPLGMRHSLIPTDASMPQPYARGYLNMEGQILDCSTQWDPSVFWAAGSMISTLDDMLLWAEALLEGSLLSPAMHQEQFTFVPIEPSPGRGYGLGVGDSQGTIGHNGNYNGLYTATLFRLEGHDIAILANGQATGGGVDSTADCVFAKFRSSIENQPR